MKHWLTFLSLMITILVSIYAVESYNRILVLEEDISIKRYENRILSADNEILNQHVEILGKLYEICFIENEMIKQYLQEEQGQERKGYHLVY